QFWVARDERPVSEATMVTLPMARSAVGALSGLISVAASEGTQLALRDHLTLLQDGSIHLSRPGLATPPDDDSSQAGLAYLRSLPLDSEAANYLRSAADLKTLAGMTDQPSLDG